MRHCYHHFIDKEAKMERPVTFRKYHLVCMEEPEFKPRPLTPEQIFLTMCCAILGWCSNVICVICLQCVLNNLHETLEENCLV